uniref:Uncharacterized protein n=1 Tax=Oryza punctata TaxID=4537 RepID=A0A0E0JER4_ORYPU
MAPPPMPPPPFFYLSPTDFCPRTSSNLLVGSAPLFGLLLTATSLALYAGASTLLRAAFHGNLGRLKGCVLFSAASIPPDRCAIKRLGIEKGKAQVAVLALNNDGIGLLHAAACQGHLNVCKFLVDELGSDVNIAGAEGLTPFMAAAESGDVPTVEYFLDHGGDVTKTDDKRCPVLHHAAAIGCCKVREFLLSKGVPVDIDCGLGTPLFHAANNGKDKALKILLDHQADVSKYYIAQCFSRAGADVNGKGTLVSPLMFAASQGGYTNFIKFLLKAGANPNIPDDLGWLPVEHAALRDFREEVEMLFRVTSPIPNVPECSVNGIIPNSKLDHVPTTVLYANWRICRLLMGDDEDALSDGNRCRMMRPNWAKAFYRWGAGHMLLKEYKHACDALTDAQKLDAGSVEIERELRKAREFMAKPPAEQ